MTLRTLTRAETYQEAKKYATPLDELIRPSHVVETADTWDEIPDGLIKDEIRQSVDIILSELRAHDKLAAVMYKRAITHHLDNTMRAPFSHLTHDTRRDAITDMYWCHDVSRGQAIAWLQDEYHSVKELPQEDYRVAREAIVNGLTDGMQPTDE